MSDSTSEITAAPDPDPDLASGEVVGEYVIDGKLGQGAFGTVFRGTHPLIGKQVAIKVLARRYSVDPEMVSRFVAEARAVNQIRHQNIIDIFAFGQLSDGRHYYVMEYLDGEPLDRLIERHGSLTLADALPILRGVARALDAAHAKSVAHRDLKAENVFLATDSDGGVWPKLLDFGIAKLLADDAGTTNATGMAHKTRTGFSIGTPYYMSPEQARGRDVDHRTDIYAFGVLAFVMLAGRYPFDGDDYMEVLIHQLQDEPAPVSSLVPDVPPGVDETIAWLMAKDPADRPPSLRDAVVAFETAAEQAGIVVPRGTRDPQTGPVGRVTTSPPRSASARSPSGAPVPRRPAPARRRAPVGLVVGVVLVIGAVVTGVVLTRIPERETVVTAPVPVPIAPLPQPIVTPPATPIDAADAEPPPVIVIVDGVPDGTEVLVAGLVIGAAPGPVQLPHGDSQLVLTFRADGYLPASRALTPDRDQALALALKKRAARRARAGTSRDDIIDVFEPRRGN